MNKNATIKKLNKNVGKPIWEVCVWDNQTVITEYKQVSNVETCPIVGFKIIKVQRPSFIDSSIVIREIALGDRGLGERPHNKSRLFFNKRLAKKYWKANLKGHFDYRTTKNKEVIRGDNLWTTSCYGAPDVSKDGYLRFNKK